MNWEFLVKQPVSDAALLCDGTRLHPDIPPGVYGKIPALSGTIIKQWIKLQHTPDEFPWWLEHRYDEPPSAPIIVGGMVDCLLLGPDVHARYAILPANAPKRPTPRQNGAKNPSPETLAAISFWAEFDKGAQYRTVATMEQFEEACKMAERLRNAGTNEGVFTHCHKAVATATLFGEFFKAEFDLWGPTDQIMDIKTAYDVSPEGFGKAFINFGYNVQATLYLRMAEAIGHPRKAFSFLCVKNVEPYTVVSYTFQPSSNPDHAAVYEATLREIEVAVESLKIARENDFKPSINWRTLDIPRWAVSSKRLLLT